jgi:mannitol 2-dehydrogenase
MIVFGSPVAGTTANPGATSNPFQALQKGKGMGTGLGTPRDGSRTAPVPLSAEGLEALADTVSVPAYDRGRVTTGIVHIGVGGFHRAHEALYLDRIMSEGAALDWGICGVGVMPADREMRDALEAQDHLYTVVEKHGDGAQDVRVVGSIVEYLLAPEDPEAVIEKLACESTRIVSLTITEGGYEVHAAEPDSSDAPPTAFGLIIEALRRRRERGLGAFTVMSCDNLEGNGSLTRAALTAYAGQRDAELAEWIEREVRCPSSMVDRITPATTDEDRTELAERHGIEDRWPVVCEPYAQWVLEDSFSAGRPPLETVGVQLVDDVRPYELMKLRLLNVGHQALAYFAALAGFEFVHEAAQDPLFQAFLLGYMDEEATPTLAPVPGIDLDQYKHTLLERFTNPHVGDTVARLCASSSDRIPQWLLPVVRAQLESDGEIRRSAAVVASWARYTEGVDEEGEPIEVVDSLRDRLMERAGRQREDPDAFIQDEIFGDLADDDRFVSAYRTALASLHQNGARATLESLGAQNAPTQHPEES